MRRVVPLVLIALLVVGSLVMISPAPVSGQSAGLVSSVLSRLENNRRGLKTLRASISMEKYNSQLRNSDRYNGVLLYEPSPGREASIRIEWRSPQHEILAVSKGKYTLFRPRLNMAYVGKSTDARVEKNSGGLLSLVYLSRKELESRFHPVQDVREEKLWGGVETVHLKLIPKGNANFKYAEVWVDLGGMPVQTKVVERNDDATTVRLSGVERNVRLSGEEFHVKLDGSVKIVKG